MPGKRSSLFAVLFLLVCDLILTTAENQVKCGTTPAINKRRRRIFGGDEANYGEVPWMINLYEKITRIHSSSKSEWQRKCGATLIAPKWIMTAAHCIASSLLNPNLNVMYKAVAGDHDYTNPDPHEQVRYVLKLVAHPEFRYLHLLNDIALLEVDRKFTLNDFVVPACLPHDDETPYPYTNCLVSGWGYDSPFSKPTKLQKLTIPVILHKSCVVIHHPQRRTDPLFTSKTMCAGYLKGGRDSCEGDSGGPLVCPRYGTHGAGDKVVAGIVSWGKGCARTGQTGVYTAVQAYIPWINTTLKQPPTYNDHPCRLNGVRYQDKPNGEITSPQFFESPKYQRNLECKWELDLTSIASPTSSLSIQFEQFDVQRGINNNCLFDSLKIWTGDKFDQLVGEFCGTSIPEMRILKKPRDAQEGLKFKFVFKTDSFVERKGFLLRFQVLP